MPSPNGSVRRRLLALASELLAGEGEPVELVEVIVRTPDGRCEHVIRSTPGELPEAVPALPPIEARVLSVLTDTYQSAKAIARLADRAAGYVRAALASLCERGLVEYRARKGYRRVRQGADSASARR